MKKYMYSFIFTILCFVGIALMSCSTQDVIKLDEPYGFITDGTYLSWENVANASHYIVKVNDYEYETETNEFDLRIISTGYNRIQVRAKEHSTKDYIFQQSDYSEVLYIKRLETPRSIYFNLNSISWETVEDATEYEVIIENEIRKVVYSTKIDSYYVSMEEISNYIMDEGKYYISVTALAENRTSVENNTFLFTTISSISNSGNILTVTHQMETPHLISLNAETQCIEWEANGYSGGCEAIIRDSQNNIVYRGKADKYYQKYSLPISCIDTTNLTDGDFTVSIKVLKPENPIWIVNYHSAIYAIEDSEIVDFNVSTNFDAALPAVENIRFYGETLYITSLIWSAKIASKYKVCLLDADSKILYSETISIKGIYLVDIYNKFVRMIQESGNYAFTVCALCDYNNELHIYDNKIIRATKDSEIVKFDFVANVNSKLDVPTNIKISSRYVGGEIQWKEPDGAAGFLVTIKNDNGIVVYNGVADNSWEGDICYFLVSRFNSYLKESGKYTIYIQAISFVNLGWSGLSKSEDGDIVEFEFYYDAETQNISDI